MRGDTITDSRVYAYARVSASDQNEARQLEAFSAAGIDERFIFLDKQSGKDFNRANYQVLMNALRRGDTLVIKSIDRLGRNYTEIQNEWKRITKEIGADIRVLDMPLLDTTVNKDNLTDTFIADIVLQILAYVAEQERVNIRRRQAEGIEAAKTRGQHLGRPRAEYPDNWPEVYDRWKAREITAIQAMGLLKLKKNTFYKLVNRFEEAK